MDPSIYYPSKDDMPGAPEKAVDPVDPAAPFRTELSETGAEAVIYLVYENTTQTNRLFVKMLRFATEEKAEAHWAVRQKTAEFENLHIIGQEILATKAGKKLRADLVARAETLECRAGRYLLRVAPARPAISRPGLDGDLGSPIDDPGLRWILLQSGVIRNLSEPAGAANRSQPPGSEPSRTPAAAGSGR